VGSELMDWFVCGFFMLPPQSIVRKSETKKETFKKYRNNRLRRPSTWSLAFEICRDTTENELFQVTFWKLVEYFQY
jgi:hypothetical protein